MLVREVAGPIGAPVLVLLHGLAATGRLNWFTAVPALAEHYNLIIVDHRGHGRGMRTPNFRLADCADDVLAMVEVLGIESFIPVGYSMGGPIAKLCWYRDPDRVSGLVLCATAKHFLQSSLLPIANTFYPGLIFSARMVPGMIRNQIIDGMVRGVPKGARRDRVRAELSASDPASVVQASRAVMRFSSNAWASRINVPTSVVICTNDELVPPRRQYSLAKSIPGAATFEIEADHVACVSAANLFVPALLKACHHVAASIGNKDGSQNQSAARA